MATTEIFWRTHSGDTAGVSVHSPNAETPDRLRLVIGHDLTLYIPPAEARRLALALIDAADEAPPPPVRRVIPIHAAPPAGLYHEPEGA